MSLFHVVSIGLICSNNQILIRFYIVIHSVSQTRVMRLLRVAPQTTFMFYCNYNPTWLVLLMILLMFLSWLLKDAVHIEKTGTSMVKD